MNWQLVESPLNDYCVWMLSIDSTDPSIMFAGTGTPNPAAIFRSTDGGQTWEKRPVQVAETCPAVGVPCVTAIAFDPQNHKNIWVRLEVDGVRRSNDGGDTWSRINGADLPPISVPIRVRGLA